VLGRFGNVDERDVAIAAEPRYGLTPDGTVDLEHHEAGAEDSSCRVADVHAGFVNSMQAGDIHRRSPVCASDAALDRRVDQSGAR
jgi:hypothetical protein